MAEPAGGAPDRLVRGLVRLLPEEFRAGYAREIEATFRAQRREAGGRPATLAAAWLWAATAGDLVRRAGAEHVEILARDTRYALRTLAARPAQALAALATLALGVGASVGMFAVLDGVLLAPLPYRDPQRLVAVAETRDGEPGNVGYLSFVDLRARARTLAGVVAAGQSSATLLGDGRDALRVDAMRVSSAYFEVLGVPPALGRGFSEAEDRPGAARRVAILSDRLWRARFDADPRVVGRAIDVSGVAHQVVGVMPRGFEDVVAARLYAGAELYFPLGYHEAASFACRSCRHLRVFARLAPGASAAGAAREIDSIFRGLEAEHPTEYHAAGARVTPLADLILGPVRPVLTVLGVAVLLLLLVACANVANLLLLRAGERTHEIAVRTALGVTRGRLARQLATESLLLGLAGGLLGTLVAWAALRALVASELQQLPRLAEVGIDGRALVCALGLSLASTALFGVVPLRQLALRPPRLAAGAGRHTASQAAWRTRSALVAASVALAALLVAGSGLVVRSLAAVLAVAPGFEPKGVLTLQLWLAGERYRAGETAAQIAAATGFYDELLARVRALPGVEAASAVTTLPLGGGVDGYGLHVAGRLLANPEAAPSADRFVVAPGYFAALRIPLLRGRLLDERDVQGGAPVVVVNRTLAAELFAGEDPLGHELSLGPPTAPRRRIVGVVGDVRHQGLDVPAGYQVYVPQAQWAWAETFLTLVVRGSGDVAALAAPIRAIVRDIDPAQPVTRVARLDDVVKASLGARRVFAGLLTAFGAATLALALVGLYGALGVYVGQRREEIGVRLALGATGPGVVRHVLRQGLRPAVTGLAVGLALAVASAGVLRSLLFGARGLDPGALAAASALLLASSTLACLLPAWRASRIDPAATLRNE